MDSTRLKRIFASPELLLFCLSLVIRYWGIGQESFFTDEAASLRAVTGDTWRHVLEVEANPPLYFYLLKLWSTIFGTSHEALRMLSAVGGALASPLLFMAARRFGMSQTASVGAALTIAISPMAVWYGQQARTYALLTTAAAAWLWLSGLALDHSSKRVLIALPITLLIGHSLHYLFPATAVGGFLAMLLVSGMGFRSKRYLMFMLTHLIGLASWLAYLPLMRIQVWDHDRGEPASWIPRPLLSDLADVYAESFWAGPWNDLPTWVKFGIGIILISASIAIVVRLTRDLRTNSTESDQRWKKLGTSLFLLASAITPPLLIYVRSVTSDESIFIKDRYTIIGLPAFLLALFYAFDFPKHRIASRTCLALIFSTFLLVSIRSNTKYLREFQEFDWRGAARIVNSEWKEGDMAVFMPDWMRDAFAANGGVASNIGIVGHLRRWRRSPSGTVWLFTWEQLPDEITAKLSAEVRTLPGAHERVDFPHVSLWQIPPVPSPTQSP